MGKSCIFSRLAHNHENYSRFSISAASKSFFNLSFSVKMKSRVVFLICLFTVEDSDLRGLDFELKLGPISEAYICPSIYFLEQNYKWSLTSILPFYSPKCLFWPTKSEAFRIKIVQGILTSSMARCHDYHHANKTIHSSKVSVFLFSTTNLAGRYLIFQFLYNTTPLF